VKGRVVGVVAIRCARHLLNTHIPTQCFFFRSSSAHCGVDRTRAEGREERSVRTVRLAFVEAMPSQFLLIQREVVLPSKQIACRSCVGTKRRQQRKM
jgi:hypothetical protein